MLVPHRRHSTAVHLLRAGVEINTTRAWLGQVGARVLGHDEYPPRSRHGDEGEGSGERGYLRRALETATRPNVAVSHSVLEGAVRPGCHRINVRHGRGKPSDVRIAIRSLILNQFPDAQVRCKNALALTPTWGRRGSRACGNKQFIPCSGTAWPGATDAASPLRPAGY
jgi:hypothetical protein